MYRGVHTAPAFPMNIQMNIQRVQVTAATATATTTTTTTTTTTAAAAAAAATTSRALQPSAILCLDNGMYKIHVARAYPALEPNTVLLDNALATMGAGLPAAIAAKVIIDPTFPADDPHSHV